ncbi:MAG TPA: hypothetical protein VFI78_05485 [Salinimicrobium sp.]|nr:hypothetical protein [Salinimicrobium sp.]
MKNIVTVICAVVLFVGCKDNPVSQKINEVQESVSNAADAASEITEKVSNVGNMAEGYSELEERMKELSKVPSKTNDELKSLLPEEVAGMKRTGYSTGKLKIMNIASINGTYANEDKSKEVSVKIVDGAGESGALVLSGKYMLFSRDFERESETEMEKSTTQNGTKAVVRHNKTNNNSTIQFMQNDRFYVEVHATNMSLEETWEFIEALDLESAV